MRASACPRADGKGRKPQANKGGKSDLAKARPDGEGAVATRANFYDEVTARIIGELEAGRFPWVQPWGQPDTGGSTLGPGLPRNALTARRYSGVNVLILWGAVIEHGYPSQGWLTFRQARQAGGCVRKGEHGTTIVYADRFTPEAEKARARDEGGEARAISFLKRFTVFNVAQCEGLRAGLCPEPTPLPEREIVPVAEQVIAASGIDFRVGGNRAFYVPAHDYVQVPPQPVCLLAGLSALSGPRHGGAGAAAIALLDSARRSGPKAALKEILASGRHLPGFGHPLYPGGDPRGAALLPVLPIDALIEDLLGEAVEMSGLEPNIDFALAVLARSGPFPDDMPFRLFALGRSAGWLAHAVEQISSGRLIRPRAHYVGELPNS